MKDKLAWVDEQVDAVLAKYSFPGHQGRKGQVGGSLPREVVNEPGVKDRKTIKDWNPREWGGMRRPPRFVMDYRNVTPIDDPAAFKQVYDAWAKYAKGNVVGSVGYDTIIADTKLKPSVVFGVLKDRFIKHQDVVFTTDRMGGGAFFHLRKVPKM